MKRKVVGIFHNPRRPEYEPRKSLAELYRRAVWLKANPRSQSYVKEVFLERCPQGRFINVDEQQGWTEYVSSADAVVILYPDSIGIGFSPIESTIKKHEQSWAAVRARSRAWRSSPGRVATGGASGYKGTKTSCFHSGGSNKA